MKSIFNLTAIIGVAFTSFFIGKYYAGSIPPELATVVDSTVNNALVDSLKEQTREMDMLITQQQDQLSATKKKVASAARQADTYLLLYTDAKERLDTLAMFTNCDQLAEEYTGYRIACDAFVQEADSIISAMYVAGETKNKIIAEQDTLIADLRGKFRVCTYDKLSAQSNSILENKKKKRWRTAAIIGGVLLLLAR